MNEAESAVQLRKGVEGPEVAKAKATRGDYVRCLACRTEVGGGSSYSTSKDRWANFATYEPP